ncbi:MAG: type III pantothenate kinase [Bacteroidales bacterium]|nr:type III pantothenate kinase [Bacteroidales bacterium]
MAHLTIDIGNTATKATIHTVKEAGSLMATAPLRHQRVEGHDLHWLRDFVKDDEVRACIVSSTIDVTPTMQRQIDSLGIPHVIRLDAATPIPIHNGYETPETLGPDRLAAAIGAYYESLNRVGEHRPVLVVDAGTAITYDLVTTDGHYLGGYISPGIHLRFLALHEHTAHLPLVEPLPLGRDGRGPGTTTHSAILHGVLDGVRHEIEGFICEFSLKYPKLLVFFTGGDMENFSESVKSRIFADEFLVSKGLDLILKYNLQK